jgi:hypothetical protein
MSNSIPRNIVVAPDAAIYENCPSFSKVECAVIQQGVAATVEWELRDREGHPVDLGGLFCNDCAALHDPDSDKAKCSDIWDILHSLNPGYYGGTEESPKENQYFVEVRIQPADEPRTPMWVAPGIVVRPKVGLLRFDVPWRVSDYGGIYVLSVGICRCVDRRPLYIHRGLLSVERSAWRSQEVDCKTPTISDIRMRIMDTEGDNLLQGYTEFSTADILDSVVSAVREWNGTAPQLANYTYTCYSFPWIEPWLNKIVAGLYQKAALRYTRNKLQISHGGNQGDDLNRDKEYLAISAMHEKLWKEWMIVKKRALNLEQFGGGVQSAYSRTVNSVGGRSNW